MLNTHSSPAIVSQPGTVPNSYLTRIMEVMLEHGQDISPSLQAANIPIPQLSNLKANISSEQYYTFIQALLNNITIDGMGFKVGRKFSINDYGILGFAFISCPTLKHAMETFFRYQAIVGNDSMFEEVMDYEKEDVSLTLISRLPTAQLLQYEVDLFLGQWSATAEAISQAGMEMTFTRLNISYPKPSYAHLYEEAFNCPIFYEQAENKILFPAKVLDQKSTMLDDDTAQSWEELCQAALNKLNEQHGLAEKVRRIIIDQPAANMGPEEVAGQLNMSYRTLRRRLSEEHTSFKEISDGVRMGLAGEYLRQTEFSTQEIAFLLGFSEVANFHRAFKKWSNITPGEYREQ